VGTLSLDHVHEGEQSFQHGAYYHLPMHAVALLLLFSFSLSWIWTLLGLKMQTPEAVMQRLTTFLGLGNAGDSMMRLARPVEVRGDAAGRTEIMRDNFSKFAERLTPRRIREIEALAFDTMQLMGYRPLYAQRQQHLGPLQQRMLRLKDGASLLAHSARKEGLASALRFHLSHARLVR